MANMCCRSSAGMAVVMCLHVRQYYQPGIVRQARQARSDWPAGRLCPTWPTAATWSATSVSGRRRWRHCRRRRVAVTICRRHPRSATVSGTDVTKPHHDISHNNSNNNNNIHTYIHTYIQPFYGHYSVLAGIFTEEFSWSKVILSICQCWRQLTHSDCWLCCFHPTRLTWPANTPKEPHFTAQRYASAVYAVVVCLSVCLSVRPSHAVIVPKRLNIRSHKQCRTIAQGLSEVYDTHRRTKLTAPETISRSRDMVGAHQTLNGLRNLTSNHAPFRDGLPSMG